jgi:DNA-binding NarL/FixJ family response regulator
MDRTAIPGDCARLLTQLVHLWQRNNASLKPPGAPHGLDAEIAAVLQQLLSVAALELDTLAAAERPARPGRDAYVKLTRRERDVLDWLAKGKTVSDVSELMQISKCTVRTYIQRSLRKLEVSNRTHAVTRALQFGLIDL